MKDLRTKTIRAGVLNLAGRAVVFVLRIGSLMILGRLLEPTDYGLVGMVTAFTGVLNMFGGFGLFQAAIQRDSLTSEQASTLFWLNILFGGVLTLATIALAPAVSSFYHEPRLLPITMVVAAGFVLTGAGVQHGAQLQRQMRFGRSAMIDIAALTLTIAIVLAAEGVNTAIEAAVDLASPSYHPLAKIAKDVGAGTVLLTAVAAVIVGLLVLKKLSKNDADNQL